MTNPDSPDEGAASSRSLLRGFGLADKAKGAMGAAAESAAALKELQAEISIGSLKPKELSITIGISPSVALKFG